MRRTTFDEVACERPASGGSSNGEALGVDAERHEVDAHLGDLGVDALKLSPASKRRTCEQQAGAKRLTTMIVLIDASGALPSMTKLDVAHLMSDRGWLVGMLGDGPDTRKLASRSMLKPWHFPIDTAEIVLDAHSSSLHTLRCDVLRVWRRYWASSSRTTRATHDGVRFSWH